LRLTDQETYQKLLLSVVRAHAWLADLTSGRYYSVEGLAAGVKLHPKVVRQGLRLAFLAPRIVSGILDGTELELTLREIPKTLPLSWPKNQTIAGHP